MSPKFWLGLGGGLAATLVLGKIACSLTLPITADPNQRMALAGAVLSLTSSLVSLKVGCVECQEGLRGAAISSGGLALLSSVKTARGKLT